MSRIWMNRLNLFTSDYQETRHSIFFTPIGKASGDRTDGLVYEHCGLDWSLAVDCTNKDLGIEIYELLSLEYIHDEWKVSEREVFHAALENAERECCKNMAVHTVKLKNGALELGLVTIGGWSVPSRNISMLWAHSFGKKLLEKVGEPCWLFTLSRKGLYFLKDSELKRAGMKVSEAEAYVKRLRKKDEYLEGPALFLSGDGEISS